MLTAVTAVLYVLSLRNIA